MRSTVSVFFFKIRVRLNPILPRFHGPDAGSLFQFSAHQRQAGHDAHSFSARRGASRPTGPAYHRGLVLFSYNRPPGGFLIGRPADFFKKYGPEGTPSGLSLSKNLCREETAQVGAGELEGAAARLEWDRMPWMPCTARRSASAARTFPPRGGGKVLAFLQAAGKVFGLFRQPAPGGHSLRAVCP